MIKTFLYIILVLLIIKLYNLDISKNISNNSPKKIMYVLISIILGVLIINWLLPNKKNIENFPNNPLASNAAAIASNIADSTKPIDYHKLLINTSTYDATYIAKLVSWNRIQYTILQFDGFMNLSASQITLINPVQIPLIINSVKVNILGINHHIIPLNEVQILALTPEQITYLTEDQLRSYIKEGAKTTQFFTYLSLYQTSILTPNQIKMINFNLPMTFIKINVLTLEQIQVLDSTQLNSKYYNNSKYILNDLTLYQISTLLPSQIALISTILIPVLDLDFIPTLSPEQIRALTISQIKALTDNQIRSLRPSQLAALSKTQITNLNNISLTQTLDYDNLDMPDLSCININTRQKCCIIPESTAPSKPLVSTDITPDIISTNIISKLNDYQIAPLTKYQLSGLSQTQIHSLSTAMIKLIPANMIQYIHLNYLTITQLNSLTELQIKALTASQIGSLNNYKISNLSTSVISKIDATKLSSLNTKNLTKSQIQALTIDQINTLLDIQYYTILNVKQQNILSPLQISYIRPEMIHLIQSRIRYLTLDQLSALTINQIKQLQPNQILDFNPKAFTPLTISLLTYLPDPTVAPTPIITCAPCKSAPKCTNAPPCPNCTQGPGPNCTKGPEPNCTKGPEPNCTQGPCPNCTQGPGSNCTQGPVSNCTQGPVPKDETNAPESNPPDSKLPEIIESMSNSTPAPTIPFTPSHTLETTLYLLSLTWLKTTQIYNVNLVNTPLTGPQIFLLSPFQIYALTANRPNIRELQLSFLLPSQIVALYPDNINYLSDVQILSIHTTQIPFLTIPQIRKLTPTQIKIMSPTQIQSFTPNQISAFNIDQVLSISFQYYKNLLKAGQPYERIAPNKPVLNSLYLKQTIELTKILSKTSPITKLTSDQRQIITESATNKDQLKILTPYF